MTKEQIDQFVASAPQAIAASQLQSILQRLAEGDGVPERSPEIVAAIKQVLEARIPGATQPAIDALLIWKKGAATPFLIAELERANAFSKKPRIIKLGRTQQPDAVEVLCQQLKIGRTRRAAKAALVEIGPAGEPLNPW